ncbi:protein dachsous-like [Rhagoletis pomonella]|uniref:protein dachsous-like n=1 Tax=Rhagoletis pomonella TaxID=28610 RepID=UPI00177BA3A6|nr:protein dachsous-like [Rhagoletis pomonella]
MDQPSNVSSRLRTTVTAVLQVTDVNDNAPQFVFPVTISTPAEHRFHMPPVATIRISDALRIGETVAHIVAVDRDAGANGEITYAIVSGNEAGYFQMNSRAGYIELTKLIPPVMLGSSGEKPVTSSVQRNSYNLVISASDNGKPTARQSLLKLHILVQGTSRNPPRFHQSVYYANITENTAKGTFVLQVTAKSFNDNGGNVGNKFSIDMHTGELTARHLDREQYSHYLLQIQAQDRGSPKNFQGHCNITVHVEDENDNDPSFEQAKYMASIPENTLVGTSVLHIKATDADLGINARLVYSLANETQSMFTIDSKSGIVTTVRPLDRERQYVYNFMVVATDGGRYSTRSASVPVQIVVDDVNDNRPIFERYPFRAQVPALVQPGQMLLQVGATDVDTGMNAEVLYSLGNNADAATRNKFRINPNTGVVSATQSLASESGRLLHIEVVARDKGNPPRVTLGLIELRVGEKAVGTPVLRFQNDTYRLKLRENMAVGMSVLQVSAVRTDGRRQQIHYSIGTGNEDGVFTINSTTGEIKVGNAAHLDYERYIGIALEATRVSGSYTYRGRAMLYEGEEELGATGVTSSVEELSDNQRSPRNQRELQTSAAKENKQFSSSATHPHELRLVLVARTSATPVLYGYAELIIELEDDNDNSPHFTQSQYSTTVWEGNNKGTFVVQVQAFDADEGANARILYHIVDGNHDNAFIIEPAFSGIVKTNIVLDREIRDMYKLKVIATDEGVPQMTGTALIRVHIVDVNDNQPTFPPHSVISVSEDNKKLYHLYGHKNNRNFKKL